MAARALAVVCLLLASTAAFAATWPAPQAPAVPGADGYAPIPGAALRPGRMHTYRAVFDATLAADKPDHLLPALNMVGSELNALAVEGVKLSNAHFAVVFHGAAIGGILNDAHYRTRHGIANPNLPVLAQLRHAGVKLYVCGQNLAAENIDPATLSPDVRIASDALLALMSFQNRGYALISF